MKVSVGVFTVILNEDKNRVLFVKRKDAPVWDLIGGRKEQIIDCINEKDLIIKTLQVSKVEIFLKKYMKNFYILLKV